MKKLTIIALALCLAVVMAAPVMAVDADFSGEYRVRGMYTEHWDLDKDSASNAYMDMRFRLQTVFKASDNLSVTTRFDALDDKVWGQDVQTAGGDDLDFDRAYMTIKTGFGQFDLGRMSGGAWGTLFVDNETEKDRIKYTKVIDNLTLMAVYQKNTEDDDWLGTEAQAVAAGQTAFTYAYISALGAGSTDIQAQTAADAAYTAAYDTNLLTAADEDSDTYYLLGKYKMENITTGLLLSFTNDKTVSTQTTHKYSAIPYFVGKFGQLGIQGELAYNWGETDYDDASSADLDFKELAYNIEASYNFGVGSVMAGYAFVSGDDNTTDNEDSAYGHVGADWEKLFILTYDESPVNNLGGVGNLSQASDYGAKIIYGGVNATTPIENLTLGLVVGMADADKTQLANQEDDFGVEYDLNLSWKIYDNLTYTAIAAYLDAGDLWKGGDPTEQIEDTYALFHQLQLTF